LTANSNCRKLSQKLPPTQRAWPVWLPVNWQSAALPDICVFDPTTRWTVAAGALASQGKHTPFLGYELSGQVKATIVAGHVAFQR
jgi:hypothetical protein